MPGTQVLRLLVSFLALVTVCSACHSFTNVRLIAKIDDQQVKKTITGCLERQQFVEGENDNPEITEIFIKEQSLPILYRDSIRHLVFTEKISITECDLHQIDGYQFRNMPRLEKVYINSCNLTEIVEGVFSSVPTFCQLRFRNNYIENIEDEAFSNITALKEIDLSYNKLREFNKNWFKNTENLENLFFQHNKITDLRINVFSEMRKLKRVNFDFNEISTVHPNAFLGISVLSYLGLRHNRLKTLSSDSFSSGLTVYSMNLGANHLNYLSKSLRDRINTEELIHDGNPWNCICMDEIRTWLNKRDGSLHTSDDCLRNDVPSCVFPEPGEGCREIIDDELTNMYLKEIKLLQPIVDTECYRDL